MYSSNRQALQEIYGVRGKKWETTESHAKTCNVGMPAFDGDCYFPQHGGNNFYGKQMILDDNFSIQDVELCYMDVCFQDQGSLPCQAYREDGIYGASNMVGRYGEGKRVKAKKRWMKMRTFLFSIASFIFGCNVRSCPNKFCVG
ncbi:hypothetical protein L2E82_51737 [Cichorium intybus]|nr:hypothetical protein L2E82_51737 [Cichorium intybus]